MTTSTQECQCRIPPEMAIAGKALQACHHTAPETIAETHTKLLDLIGQLTHTIPISEVYNRPFQQVAEDYMKGVVGHDFTLINETEYNILMMNFLRFMSLSFQATLTAIATQTQENTQNPDQAQANPFGRHQNRDIDFQNTRDQAPEQEQAS